MGVSVAELIAFLGLDAGALRGSRGGVVERPAALAGAGEAASVSFCDRDDAAAAEAVQTSKSRMVLVPRALLEKLDSDLAERTLVGCESPRADFIRLLDHFWPEPAAAEQVEGPSFIHDSAAVAADAQIHAGVTIGPGCEVGAGSVLFSGVRLYRGTRIGTGARIDSNAVIGSPGFGFERTETGGWRRFPQLAGVRIGDEVEVGAGACIDRGALSDTVIGRGTKIDNLVYIAHNTVVGEDCLIMASSVIAGSCRIGDRVVISPGACVRDGIAIDEAAHVGMGAVVTADVPANTVVMGVPAKPVREGNYRG